MKWEDVRNQYPNKWLLFEALKAHTTNDDQRIVEELAAINAFTDFYDAMRAYKDLHHETPEREMYVVHTDNEKIKIAVRRWLGVRGVS